MPITITLRVVQPDIVKKVEEISGQNIHRCMQCGQCSGSCPMFATGEIDTPPRRIMHLLQMGDPDAVMAANTAWMCAACQMCQVRCPRGVDLPRVMEAVRLLTLRRNQDYVEPARVTRGAPQIAMVGAFRKLTA